MWNASPNSGHHRSRARLGTHPRLCLMERSDPTREAAPLLAEQIHYYDDRAPEYEDLWFRRGKHDLGPDFNERWFRETATVESAVDGIAATGNVLEVGSVSYTHLTLPTICSV